MKKIFGILMFLAVFGMLIGSVAAADLEEHDFNGHFTLKVPGSYWMGVGSGGHTYENDKGVRISYFTVEDVEKEGYNNFDDYIKSLGLKDEKTDGNLTIFKDGSKNVVIAKSNDEMYIIKDKDLDEAKAIAASANLGTDENNASDNGTIKASSPVKANVDLESKDFNDFKMDIPKGSEFKNSTDSEAEYNGGVIYTDSNNDVNITFVDDNQIDDKFVKDVVSNLEKAGAKSSTNGNLNLIEAGPYNEVVFNNGTKMIMITSSKLDLNTLTAMAQSVEFTK